MCTVLGCNCDLGVRAARVDMRLGTYPFGMMSCCTNYLYQRSASLETERSLTCDGELVRHRHEQRTAGGASFALQRNAKYEETHLFP